MPVHRLGNTEGGIRQITLKQYLKAEGITFRKPLRKAVAFAMDAAQQTVYGQRCGRARFLIKVDTKTQSRQGLN